MARGWESKAVADQIEEEKAPEPPRDPRTTTPQERERRARLESLRLSRSRLLEQLDRASQPAYRNMLLKGLSAIEEQIEAVSSERLKNP